MALPTERIEWALIASVLAVIAGSGYVVVGFTDQSIRTIAAGVLGAACNKLWTMVDFYWGAAKDRPTQSEPADAGPPQPPGPSTP
jgi:hypothetical protein